MAAKDESKIKSATAGLFAGMRPLADVLPGQQNITDYPEAIPADQAPQEPPKAETKPKAKGKPVSVWTSPETSAQWKAYATATGCSVSELAGLAMAEYMDRHRLTGKQKAVYDALID